MMKTEHSNYKDSITIWSTCNLTIRQKIEIKVLTALAALAGRLSLSVG